MIASRDSFPSELRRACDRGVNHRFDFIERDDLICRILGAQCPAGGFLNLRWFGRRITSGRVGRRNHWHPRRGEGSVWTERGGQAAELCASVSQRDGSLRAIESYAPRPVAAPSQTNSNDQPTLLIPG